MRGVLLVLLALLGAGAAHGDYFTSTQGVTPNILVIGDSVTIRYRPELTERLGKQVALYGLWENARYTGYALDRWSSWMLNPRRLYPTPTGKLEEKAGRRRHWDVLLVNWGLWDVAQVLDTGYRTEIEDYRENLHALIELALAVNGPGYNPPRVVVSTTTPIPEDYPPVSTDNDVILYNSVMKEVVNGFIDEGHPVRLNDLYAFTKPHQAEWQIPGDTHFVPEADWIIAGRMAQIIRDEIEEGNQAAGLPALSSGGLVALMLMLAVVACSVTRTAPRSIQ